MGEQVGRSATDLARGVARGVDTAMEVPIELTADVTALGLEQTSAKHDGIDAPERLGPVGREGDEEAARAESGGVVHAGLVVIVLSRVVGVGLEKRGQVHFLDRLQRAGHLCRYG